MINFKGITKDETTAQAQIQTKQAEALYIQSKDAEPNNTIINATNDGKVGIGERNPTEKLSVNGNALINGNITATGVVSAGTLQADNLVLSGTSQYNELHVLNRVKVGNSIYIDGINNTNTTDHIYTSDETPPLGIVS